MKCLPHWLVIVVNLLLAATVVPSSASQTNNVTELAKRVASLYEQDRYAEAIPLAERVLAIREKTLGPNHPIVAMALNDLAVMYLFAGRSADAEPLYNRALAIFEKLYGPNNPAVAAELYSVGFLYYHEGRYSDAEPLLKRSLAIWEKTLGPTHPEVAHTLATLALVYVEQHRYGEAEASGERSLAIAKRSSGPQSADLAAVQSNLAMIFKDEGRYADAETLYKQALAIGEKVYGPDNFNITTRLNNLAELYRVQGRYVDAEPLYKRALTIWRGAFGPDYRSDTMETLVNNLALLYLEQGRYNDALPMTRSAIAQKTAVAQITLPVLFGGQSEKIISADEALVESLDVLQRASQTAAGQALSDLAVRFSVGDGRLAQLVRQDQDLAAEASSLDKSIVTAVGNDPSRASAATQAIRDQISAVAKAREDLARVFAREFPDYLALSNPQPLTVKDIQALLAEDEALVIVHLATAPSTPKNGPEKSYIWAITHSAAEWKDLSVSADDISKEVSALRNLLDFNSIRPFDAQASFDLYQKVLAPVEGSLVGKPRLSFVLNGALTSLPPQLLVTHNPAGKALKDVDWLIRTHAVTELPSVESLKVLRGKSAMAAARQPLIGFADPIFNPDSQLLTRNTSVAHDVTAARGISGTVAHLAALEQTLAPLPDSADELREVAASVHADPADIILGPAATVTRVKKENLDRFRIVYFATHGLVAGDVAQFANLNAEPALVLSLPEHPTAADNGLLDRE